MQNNRLEFWVGCSIIVIAFIIAFTFLSTSFNTVYNRYYVSFEQVNGIGKGTPVKINGYIVGKVDNVSLNEKYKCQTAILVDKKYKLSSDSKAETKKYSMIGTGKYIAITPGRDRDEFIKDHGKILNASSSEFDIGEFAKSAISLFTNK